MEETVLENPICVRCRKTGAQQRAETGAVLMCDPCRQFVMNYPVPLWVRRFFYGLLIITCLSFTVQARFIAGYVELRLASRALRGRDINLAMRHFRNAANRVPESREVVAVAAYFDALKLLNEERPKEALEKLQLTHGALPSAFSGYEVESSAQIAVAFDEKDYDRMVTLSEESVRRNRGATPAKMALASAMACKYAATGDESSKTKVEDLLSEVKGKLNNNPEFTFFEQRMRHRLTTHEIIGPTEYKRRYPQGWTEPQNGVSQ